MKKTLIFAITHFSIVCNGIEIPHRVLDAIAQVEGGQVGMAKKEGNGRYSYGRYQIGKAFLTDVNRYYDAKFTVADVRDSAAKGRLACSMGLVMIMQKRKCTLETAIAVYNGGWRNRNSKQCKSYVKKVMAIAEKGVVK